MPLPEVEQAAELVKLALDAALKEAGDPAKLRDAGLCVAWSNNLDVPEIASAASEVRLFPFSTCSLGSDGWFHTADGARRGLLVVQCVRVPGPDADTLLVDGIVRAGSATTHGFTATIARGPPMKLQQSSTTWFE